MVSAQLSLSLDALPAIGQSQRFSGALRDLSKASGRANTSLGVLDKQFGRFGRFAGPAGIAIEGFVEVFDQSRILTAKALDNAERLESLSTLTDVLPERLQTIERFGLSQGVGRADIGEVLIGLTKNVQAAIDGSEDIESAFGELGVNVAELAEGARNVEAIFIDVLSSLQSIGNAGKVLNLSDTVFGDEGRARTAAQLAGFEGDIADFFQDRKNSGPFISNQEVESGAIVGRGFALAENDFAIAAQNGALEASAGSLIDLAETLQDPILTRGAEGLGTAAGSIIELAASGADVALENVAPVNSNNEDVEQSFDFEAEVDPATNTTLQLDYFVN